MPGACRLYVTGGRLTSRQSKTENMAPLKYRRLTEEVEFGERQVAMYALNRSVNASVYLIKKKVLQHVV